MSETTKIEWADSTFNPWMGCTKVSPACDHCYAERDTKRFGRVEWGAGKPRIRTSEANWRKPIQWNAQPFVECPECGWRGEWREADARCGCCPSCGHLPRLFKPARRRVFCASLADVFDNEVSVQWRRDLFDLIHATPNLDWLLLTKRIGNAKALYGEAYLDSARPWPTNVWLGATICNQAEADRDIPKLLATPAAVRFLSVEPMLGQVKLIPSWVRPQRGCGGKTQGVHHHDEFCGPRLDWVICGGESGPQARPMHPMWVRSLRDQCAEAGVPFLFKQWGEWAPLTLNDGPTGEATMRTAIHFHPPGTQPADMHRPGKQAAGRMLDGRTHTEFPGVRHGG